MYVFVHINESDLHMGQVPGKRLTDKFRKNNADAGFKYVPGGRLPPRRASAHGIPPTPASPSTPPIENIPARSGRSPDAAGSSRRVLSDFKPFGAAAPGSKDSKPLSVFGAPLLATGPGGGMFGAAGKTPAINGGMRGGFRGGGDEEDDDEEDGGSGFSRDAISLDQVS